MTSAPQGGYRQPSNPAPVSGPGALSQRTDGGALEGMTQPAKYISGLPWGEGQATYDQQTSAPMAGGSSPVMPDVTPLMAPTKRPNEPVTMGNDMGAGAGSEALAGMPNFTPSPVATFRQLAQFDNTGEAELIYRALLDGGIE